MAIGRISPRARNYVRKQATAVMEATVRIERIQRPQYSPTNTLVATAGGRQTLYEGPCRIWESTGQSAVALGEAELILQSTNLSIPWNAEFLHGAPQREDEFEILSHNTDDLMVGKRGVIQDVAKAGELRATRRFAVQLLQPHGDNG